jgi:hypothetical protein
LTQAPNKNLSKEVLVEFFDLYTRTLEENGFQDQLERLFNLDETSLNGNTVSGKVYVTKGKESNILNKNCGKTNFSVLFCCNAKGEYMPPFVIYNAQHLYDLWMKNGPERAVYTATNIG